MSSGQLSIAFSPCPNDTFIFNALVNGQLKDIGFTLQEPVLEDVETLNQYALQEKYDITKISYHAYGHVSEKYVLLGAGSALGRGCGPLLVRRQNEKVLSSLKKIAIPGRYTTAAMLLKLYMPDVETVSMPFDTIMASILQGDVDAGVIIHESRFTYKEKGLSEVVDLGEWWEQTTGCPIPLGGIAIRRSLAPLYHSKVDNAIRESICWAEQNRKKGLPYIRSHSQELSEKVVSDHIALYVNDYSKKLGKEGRNAIRTFLEKGCQNGLFFCNTATLF